MRNSIFRSLLFAAVVLVMASASFAQVAISVRFGPPLLPVYAQPICPGDGYIWTPGYWAWADDGGYYWVPGTWVLAPEPGFLWTPPWWGFEGGVYLFHEGFWGPHVGFYGGINYGFGYFGNGFVGGRWDNGRFFYNRSVTNVNVTEIHNVYNTTVINNNNHVSFNGGEGGVNARPTAEEEAAARDRHIPPPAQQMRHVEEARSNPQLRASANEGKPPIAATARAGEFNGRGVEAAREAGGRYTPPPNQGRPGAENNGARPEENRAPGGLGTPANPPMHVRDLPAYEKPAAPNTGNPKLDQKYAKQQAKLQAKQDQERQKLQAAQDREDQRVAKRNANDAKKQQTEQRHQQQTQALQQRHTQQQQRMMQRQSPPPAARPEGRTR